jgi:hypothetical protein
MLHDFRLAEEFFAFLVGLDEEIARRVAMGGCRHCGGPLYLANYKRKPRGGEIVVIGESALRHSLCCGREGCRKRALPPSLRFLGRRVYAEAVVLLASALALVRPTLGQVREATSVPRRTLRRWLAWWQESFPQTSTWMEVRARLAPPPPDEALLPLSLLQRLRAELGGPEGGAQLDAVCVLAAQLLAPVTTCSVSDGARFVRGLEAAVAVGGFAQKMVFGRVGFPSPAASLVVRDGACRRGHHGRRQEPASANAMGTVPLRRHRTTADGATGVG